MISVSEADQLAQSAHGCGRTRSGGLFIEHVRRVAAQFAVDPDPYAVPAALLHDTVEKTDLQWRDLIEAGVDDRLLTVVDALTERDGEPLQEYLARCVADPLALRIKRVDISDKLTVASQLALSADAVEEVRARAHRRLDLLETLAAAGTPR
jgi:(p)ppGpp synthase/HD superfamily hydrolase